jgi:hypothetical protein
VTVGLVQACDALELFALRPWPRQRVLLESAERVPGQAWCVGRQSGKTTLAGAVCLHNAVFRPDLDRLMRPGTIRYAIAVGTNLAQARNLLAGVVATAEASPVISDWIESKNEDEVRFTLPSGARTAVRAFPCSSRGIRGFTASCVVMDEAAHHLDQVDGPQAAGRVWAALRPLTRRFGERAQLVVCSTPWGDTGFFAERFQRAQSGELGDGWAAHQYSSPEMDPSMTEQQVEQLRLEDPDLFDSEILARFVGGGNQFLDPDRYDVLADGEVPPDQATRWIAGLDPSFSRDAFGVCLVGVNGSKLVIGRVEALIPPRPETFAEKHLAEEALLGRVADILAEYRCKQAVTDQHLGKAVAEHLGRRGINVRVEPMHPASKTSIYRELRTRLYAGELELPPNQDLLVELRRLRTKMTDSGLSVLNPRVGASHGDMAQALALAVAEHRFIGRRGAVRKHRVQPKPLTYAIRPGNF